MHRTWEGADSGTTRFRLGVLFVLGLGLVALLSAGAIGRLLSLRTIISIWNYALLPVGLLAFVLAAGRYRGSQLGEFLGRVSLAFSFWLIVGVLRAPLAAGLSPLAFSLFRDAMFAGFYVAFLWAVEWASGGASRSKAEKTVALVGSVALVAGSVAYLRVLPELLGTRGDPVPYLVLYAGLDVYLAIRLGLLVRRARRSDQRLVYGLLAATLLLIALAELLDFGFASGSIPASLSPSLSVFWAIPFVPMLLAAHVRQVESRDENRRTLREGDNANLELFTASWSPLIGYGFVLPAAHLLLYSAGWGSEAVEQLRGWFILSWLAVLALLVFAQRVATAHRVAINEGELRESYERIRRLSGAREDAIELERRRLSRELDDGLSDQLIELQGELLRLKAAGLASEPEPSGRLEAAASLTREALDSSRRISAGLRPRMLDELGLAVALRELAANTAASTRLDVNYTDSAEHIALDPAREIVMYRVAQEGLTNCVKHSRAGRVEVELARSDHGARLEIRDDGVGLAADAAERDAGLGLLSIRERVRSAGGHLAFGTGIGGRGFSIRVSLPW